MAEFDSILVANRGEIACRVMRTAKALGYRTVAVYSQVDAKAPHVQMADRAVCIGPGPVGESYLLAQNVIDAAQQAGAGAIHPGYGFLSENANFARAVKAAGLVFIGPGADAIDLMGNKAAAKRRMIAAGVPCVPGYEGDAQDDASLRSQAERIGLPLMVKAAAGGGGRGMRLVHETGQIENAIALARAEAQSAFGNGELILEKAIMNPRHVEVQVFADQHGQVVHLGERDCSVQRRHQKVVEEAPCPVMTPELRARMGQAAVEAARSIDYVGAGTVEFLLDAQGEFYFLEMNTRLQVEHPVTELITGLDLVALQIQVAHGQPLGLTQDDVQLSGHAMEVRLYAEDPSRDFLPVSGPIALWAPSAGAGIRVDSGVCSGQFISPFYDPMVAKVIASGPTREVARRRLIEALQHSVFFGTCCNKDFLVDCLSRKTFIDGAATTAFIADEFSDADLAAFVPDLADCAAAAVVELSLDYEKAQAQAVGVSERLRNWSSASAMRSRKSYRFEDASFDLWVTPLSDRRYQVSCGDQNLTVAIISLADGTAHAEVDGKQRVLRYLQNEQGMHLALDGKYALFVDQVARAGESDEDTGGGRVLSPMHGLLLEIFVQAGDKVTRGQPLAVVEAMKLHHEIQAQVDGVVLEIHASTNSQVAADELLLEIEPGE